MKTEGTVPAVPYHPPIKAQEGKNRQSFTSRYQVINKIILTFMISASLTKSTISASVCPSFTILTATVEQEKEALLEVVEAFEVVVGEGLSRPFLKKI